MKSICAWCKTVMSSGNGGEHRIGHGICKPCAEKWEADICRFVTAWKEHQVVEHETNRETQVPEY